MNSVVVNGSRLVYDRVGCGADLVLVHGLGANRAFWRLTVVPLLSRQFTVTSYDLRGHGLSDVSPRGYTTRDMADDLAELLEAAGIRSAHVVGHSFGGAVALHHAVRRPQQVRSLVLADARIAAFERPVRLRDWSYWPEWKRKIRDAGGPVPDANRVIDHRLMRDLARPEWRTAGRALASHGIFLPASSGKGRHSTATMLDRLLETTTAPSDTRAVAGLDAASVAMMTRPTLALYGEYSHCLRSMAGLRDHLPDCTSKVIPRVGHFFPAVMPGPFAREVSSFVEARAC